MLIAGIGGGRLVETETILSASHAPVYVFVIQSFAAIFCFGLGKFACKICIQVFMENCLLHSIFTQFIPIY